MMLMLPSAWRENRETLRLFRDNGGFTEFFPAEDDINGHTDLLKKFPNLDVFNGESPLFPKQIKTSLGNTLRILSPIIILDEGHKAYGENSQKALYDFNPSIIVELSATPLNQSNSLVDISGMALNNEGMIKLDLHIVNKASVKWEDTLLSAINKRNILEEKAKEYEANAGRNIRPICLIQVERTGKDQKGKGFIHADDIREYLIKQRESQKNISPLKQVKKTILKELTFWRTIAQSDTLSQSKPCRKAGTAHLLMYW